eukprot:350149-Chlamydomonas_euryale.AAC.4
MPAPDVHVGRPPLARPCRSGAPQSPAQLFSLMLCMHHRRTGQEPDDFQWRHLLGGSHLCDLPGVCDAPVQGLGGKVEEEAGGKRL